jgi:hypothetical protein
MIYIYRTKPSNSARALCEALGATRRRAHNINRRSPVAGDFVVCWGESYSGSVPTLNGAPLQDKFQDALKLREAGVPTVEVVRERPTPQSPTPVVDPLNAHWGDAIETARDFIQTPVARSIVVQDGIERFISVLQRLHDTVSNPPAIPVAVPTAEWLGRSKHHVGGQDLLNPPGRPDYYVKKESLVNEYRVHSFNGTSLRAGKKKPIQDSPHPWVRSLLAGWKISYDGVSVKQVHRDLAHRAVKALGLDFGAVDIGEKADGTLIVLEVNRAPGLDGGTITAYAEAIRKWVASGTQ